jgi:hypothetical protein
MLCFSMDLKILFQSHYYLNSYRIRKKDHGNDLYFNIRRKKLDGISVLWILIL